METHHSSQEAQHAFGRQFGEAIKESDQWLAVIWTVVDGKLTMRRTSNKFPHQTMGDACNVLMADMRKESLLDTSPLPEAPGFPSVPIGDVVGESSAVAKAGGAHAIP